MFSFILALVMLILAAAFFVINRKYRLPPEQKNKLVKTIWTICAVVFVISMISHPKTVYDGAVMGLKAWWNIVFPSLLPFFIASELLLNFGVVHFLGVLLEPVMRPMFNVPGAGSFVMCIGFTSGYPIGSMVTARLRSQRLCTRVEAERLMSFTNNSSPLFMLVAVSVGMFGQPELGVVIAGAHYLANLTLGFALRFYGRGDRETLGHGINTNESLLVRAFREMSRSWQQESRPPGKIIGDAVRNAINSLLNIGGFIILFGVIIKLLTLAGFIDYMAWLLGGILIPLGFSAELMPALASGFFEMTIGSKMASEASAPLVQQVAAVGVILAWSGLSVQAQVASMISDTDIRMFPFICTRIAHAALAGLYTFILFGPARPLATDLARPAIATLERVQHTNPLLASFEFSLIMMASAGAALLSLSLFCIAIRKMKIYL